MSRAHRRLDHPREQVLENALQLIGEQGLAGMTMAALAARLGTSGGHLLYYFGSKDQLLMETLRWSEASYTERRQRIAAIPAATPDTVVAFADLFLPVDARDPRWLLWLELWARSPYVEELVAAQRELDSHWRHDLLAIVESGRSAGVFTCSHVDGWCDRLLAMLDGFSIGLVTGGATVSRDLALDHSRAMAGQLTRLG